RLFPCRKPRRRAGLALPRRVLSGCHAAALVPARIVCIAHDPEKWEPVFGKDHAQTNESIMADIHVFPAMPERPHSEPPKAPAYAELAVTTNFSFLRSGSHPEEFVTRARELGLAGLGIADGNSVAGVVRAYVAAKPEEGETHQGL